jgi:hypothetical protein
LAEEGCWALKSLAQLAQNQGRVAAAISAALRAQPDHKQLRKLAAELLQPRQAAADAAAVRPPAPAHHLGLLALRAACAALGGGPPYLIPSCRIRRSLQAALIQEEDAEAIKRAATARHARN